MPPVVVDNQNGWLIVSDDRCPVVRRLSWLIRQWDRAGTFTFVSRDESDERSRKLLEELDDCPWSLILAHDSGVRIAGPEAIPFILKTLPGGKIAAVAYIVPGIMWLTRQLYMLVSRNRHLFSHRSSKSLAA